MSNNSALILLGRILLSIMFILAGFSKLMGLAGTAGFFGSLGLPAPMIVAVLVGLLELLGGIAILIGFQTRIAALALGVFTLAATALAHMNFGDPMQVLLLQKNLGVAGGFFILAAAGAGLYSVDAKRG
ncbi:DoxX family membrane protein [Mesorhizobium sp. NBSH29]|uniref:DoxX family protein n=1 Tax=Mesorhizobium sp. NBSH29 TaxID=2654249 RepID=UPI0018965866|nr:DoxX family protein [Mesorhizobium sp. NBSH29]QPC86840.1 DoxX family membrane protein [Mesorhizobium sp. NBSH29]